MVKSLIVIAVAGSAFFAAAPAAAEHRSVAPQHRYSAATTLGLRMRSIELQIDILRDRGQIGRAEAEVLHRQSRILQRRLYGMSQREAREVEIGIDRLEDRVRFAADDARIGGHLFDREADRGRLDDEDRYERDRSAYRYDRDRGHDAGADFRRWNDSTDRSDDFREPY